MATAKTSKSKSAATSASATKKAPPPDPNAAERAFVEHVGEAVRTARAVRSLTQVDLADRAELSSNYLARLERGEVSPSLWVAHRLATALGTTVGALLEKAVREAPPVARSKFARARRHAL